MAADGWRQGLEEALMEANPPPAIRTVVEERLRRFADSAVFHELQGAQRRWFNVEFWYEASEPTQEMIGTADSGVRGWIDWLYQDDQEKWGIWLLSRSIPSTAQGDDPTPLLLAVQAAWRHLGVAPQSAGLYGIEDGTILRWTTPDRAHTPAGALFGLSGPTAPGN
jgi:hypothetical protein